MSGAALGEIYIDGQAWTTGLSAPASVADVYADLVRQIRGAGRLVVEILLDGEVRHWQDGSPAWQLPFDHERTLDIHTDTPGRMVEGVFTGIVELLEPLASAHRTAAELLRRGERDAGVAATLESFNCWPDISEGLNGICQLTGIDFADPTLQPAGGEVLAALEQLQRRLNDFREAADLADDVLLADLLEYELAPLAEKLRPLCERLAAQFSQRLATQGGAT